MSVRGEGIPLLSGVGEGGVGGWQGGWVVLAVGKGGQWAREKLGRVHKVHEVGCEGERH